MAKLEPILRENILLLARTYAKAERARLASVSRVATGDSGFFDRLAKQEKSGPIRNENDRQGSFTARKYDEVMTWFSTNWPAGLKRPVINDVPQRSKRSAPNGPQVQAGRNSNRSGKAVRGHASHQRRGAQEAAQDR